MKKFCLSLFLLGFLFIQNTGVFAFENVIINDEVEVQELQNNVKTEENKTLEASVAFDWIDIDQAKRDEQIAKYRNLLFEEDSDSLYYDKETFKKTFSKFYKDKDFKHHYMLTNNGVTEDEDAKYCAFYYKQDTLVMYAIQYLNNPHNAFYYSAFGKLYYVDVTSSAYPNYPYYSMQYSRNGKLKSAIYFVSQDMQYMYGADKEFQGLWYKDKMYSASGKQTLTRTSW